MRFMMLTKEQEQPNSHKLPDAAGAAATMKYLESLEKIGVLPAFDGLHAAGMGPEMSFSGAKPVVTDGPFSETIGGYILQTASRSRLHFTLAPRRE